MRELTVQKFSDADLEGYLKLSQAEYGGSVSCDAEHIKWKHLNSEFGASSYVKLSVNQRVVGRVLIQQRILRTLVGTYKLGQVMDLLIDKDHRTSPKNFIDLTKACGNVNGFDSVFHTSNARSFPFTASCFVFLTRSHYFRTAFLLDLQKCFRYSPDTELTQ